MGLGARGLTWAVWGAVLFLLLVGFRRVDMGNLHRLFENSENMRTYGAGLLHPDWGNWRLYVGQMWLTVLMGLWGTVLSLILAVPLGLACARNITPLWVQQSLRRLVDLDARRARPGDRHPVHRCRWPRPSGRAVLAIAVNTGGVLAKLFSEA